MSKIICDMCGTAYPESAEFCPICGCTKGENPQIVADDTPNEKPAEGVRTPVKGGKFSKANVRKRNKAAFAAAGAAAKPANEEKPGRDKVTTGLIIAIVILLLAIIAVMAFIYVRYMMPQREEKPGKNEGTVQTTLAPDTTAAPDTEPPVIKCEDLSVKTAIVELVEKNEAWLLEVTASPENTTDTITFESSDESVVTVSDKGRVTAVGAGQAVITITCGDQQAKCRVVCNFQEETEPQDTTVPEETEPTETVDPNGEISLNREDFTMSKQGETWQIYNGTIGKNLVTFTSDDETVVTIEGGVVTAVGPGITKVHAEYGDQKVSCIVRCSFPGEEGGNEGGNGGMTEDPVCTISHTDVTLSVGETFKLTLKDGGNVVNVTWKVADSAVCSVSGNTVTGKASGTTTVSVSYGGNTYTCTVRVK